MQFQFNMGPPSIDGTPSEPPEEPTNLLRQILEVQREQTQLLKTLIAMQDGGARWRALLGRWKEQFPETGSVCKQSVGMLEKAYLQLLAELGERLEHEAEDDGLENDFILTEFLDRYGSRLVQLGNMLNLITPIADAAPREE